MATLLTAPRTHVRGWLGLGLGVAGLALVTAVLAPQRSLTNAALVYLVPVVAVAVVGGVWLGLATAIGSDLLLNWFFVAPYHTFAVERRENLLALLVYVLVAVTVSLAVDLAARQRAAAVRSGIEARLLARIAATPAAEQSLTQLLGHVRDTFDMRWVALVEAPAAGPAPASGGPFRQPDSDDEDTTVAMVGIREGEPSLSVAAAPGLRLVAGGPDLFGEDRRLLGRLAAAAARTLETQRLALGAARAEQLAEIDRLRTAILAAVGHDLRTPLASIKASASSLRAPDVAFSPEDSDELLATIEESTDQLSDLVENLLAMSRLQAGVLSVQPRALALDEVVARALLAGRDTRAVEVAVPDDLPMVRADPGLLERVVANLVSNAVRASPQGPVTVRADAAGPEVLLKIIDHGTGIRPADRERVFAPFQRLGDRTADGGLGLGLAIARGFTEAMGGTVTPEDTPGGGLTMTVALPVAAHE